MLFRHILLIGVIVYVVVVLFVLLICGVFVVIGCYLVEEQDEYVCMLMIWQMLIVSVFVFSFVMIWGFFESFDFVYYVEVFYIVVLWFVGFGFGVCVNKLIVGCGV